MMKYCLLISCLLLTLNAHAANPQAMVFVSFSLPAPLLKATLQEAAIHKIPAILRGLHEGSMRKTLTKLFNLAKTIPNLSLQIDPTRYKKYHINRVPAVVVDTGQSFDVLYGNLSIQAALEVIADKGETHIKVTDIIGESDA